MTLAPLMRWVRGAAAVGVDGVAAPGDDAADAVARRSTRRCAGTRKMSRFVAKLVPFYEYDEARFFRSDGAPDDVAERAPRRVHAAGRRSTSERFAETVKLTARGRRRRSPTCSSPPPTACRSSTAASCASTCAAGAFVRVVGRRRRSPTSTATGSTT